MGKNLLKKEHNTIITVEPSYFFRMYWLTVKKIIFIIDQQDCIFIFPSSLSCGFCHRFLLQRPAHTMSNLKIWTEKVSHATVETVSEKE